MTATSEKAQGMTATTSRVSPGEQLEGQIVRNPFSAVLAALGVGFLVGLMSRR